MSIVAMPSLDQVILALPFTGNWSEPHAFLSRNIFALVLVAIFFLLHRFDDHRRIKLLARNLRPEIFWPTLLLFWVVAIALSQGNTAEFIYFEF